MSIRSEKSTRETYGEPPSDDPVERAGHVVKVYMDPNVGGTTNESEVLVTATKNAYGQGVWTGMTWGDLQKLWALAEQAQEALFYLGAMEGAMDILKAPEYAQNGKRLTTAERMSALLCAPFQPRREDAVARWLKRMRDTCGPPESLPAFSESLKTWHAINDLLDRYRECADCGLSLEPENDEKGDR